MSALFAISFNSCQSHGHFYRGSHTAIKFSQFSQFQLFTMSFAVMHKRIPTMMQNFCFYYNKRHQLQIHEFIWLKNLKIVERFNRFLVLVDDVIENWLPLIKQILNLNYKMKSRSIYFIVKNNKYMYLTFNKEVAIFLNYQTIM